MSDGGDFSMMDLFREEVRAHAATLSQGLVNLENGPATPQAVEPLMRAAHSIKGAARIVNIDPAVQLAHAMEDALVAAQEGRIHINPEDVDALLRGTDVLAGLSQVGEADLTDWSAAHAAEVATLKERFRLMAKGQSAPAAAIPVVAASESPTLMPAPAAPSPPVTAETPPTATPTEEAPPPAPPCRESRGRGPRGRPES